MPKKPTFDTIGDEPIEARIVAWVLGDASAFEAAELERLCEERPELLVFRRRMRALHGLLTEAEAAEADHSAKLPPEKRRLLDELFGVETPAVLLEARGEARSHFSARRVLLAIAACLALMVVLGGLAAPRMVRMSKQVSLALRDRATSNPAASVESSEVAIRELKKAIRAQEDAVEERRKVLANITRQKGIVYHGAGMDDEKGAKNSLDTFNQKRNDAIKRGLDAQDYVDAKLEFEGEQQLLQQMKLKLLDEGIASKMPAAAGKVPPMLAFQERDGSNKKHVPLKTDYPPELIEGTPKAILSELKSIPYEAPVPQELASRGDGKRREEAADRVARPELAQHSTKDGLALERRSGNAPAAAAAAPAAAAAAPAPDAPQVSAAPPVLRMRTEGRATEKGAPNDLAKRPSAHETEACKSEPPPTTDLFKAFNKPAEPARAGAPRAMGPGAAPENKEAAEVVEPPATPEPEVEKTQPAEPPAPDLTAEGTAAAAPYSTFSLSISDASFKMAQAALARGERPEPASIKLEQFYNAVDYGDPAPGGSEPVAAWVEQAAHPVIPGRNLVRVALRTGAAGRSAAQPLRLTLLVDQSGSMAREDRRLAMANALTQLGGLLTKRDLVTVIGFSRAPRLLADALPGDQAAMLNEMVNQAASEGGTNLEEALKLGEQMALQHQTAGAQNRVVLFTDGAANLGAADPLRLAERVKALRQKGLAFDVAGIGTNDLNDRLLGELARHGNGRYSVTGTETDADGGFARQLAGAFRPAAENVKVQVRFNPQRVGKYKLLGFEAHRLKTEDFRNDAVDAAELAAEEAGVALYQVEPLADGTGELGEVSVRFRDAASGRMVERTWTIPYEATAPAFDQAAPSLQLAGLAMLAAEKLRGGPLAAAIDFKLLAGPRATVKQYYSNSRRVAEMLEVVGKL